MLKLTYTDNGFHLEYIAETLENWVTNRVLLALRSGMNLGIEPSTAAFLLPYDIPYLSQLKKLADGENQEVLELSYCDQEAIEVTLEGTWITGNPESEEGIFVTVLSDRAEVFLYQIWKESYFGAYAINE
ncbi:MAG: hypothetical protein N5P05_003278 [Chroococcopsis gigantea SAG 12.99]|jgi:hypothetical protein|nr:hypothetical protein [Chlorogloea purpurea SAG 13.99]MDV3001672.1 hypothetical protein [Chroococcopsis gigantea SAG 12.99]